jgi:hypothetical protein
MGSDQQATWSWLYGWSYNNQNDINIINTKDLRWCHLAERVLATHIVVWDSLDVGDHHSLRRNFTLVKALLPKHWNLLTDECRLLALVVTFFDIPRVLLWGVVTRKPTPSKLDPYWLGVRLKLGFVTKYKWALIYWWEPLRKIKHFIWHESKLCRGL